jgi:protein-S-isoprenylcysteine O-methyltransferase Ste14
MPLSIFAVLTTAWVAWTTPFFLIKRKGGAPQTLDRRARWGIVLQAIAYFLVWQPTFWTPSRTPWRISVAVVFLTLGPWLSWTSARTLGRQWRFDAGLNADHQLIRSGAYRFIRHPIYASMMCMLIGTGLLLTQSVFLLVAVILFVVGVEIRVRVEDALLASRFGDEFREYQRKVPAYLPLIR